MKNAYKHKHIPGEADAPVLFLFHGTGGDEKQLTALGKEFLPGATLVAPRGDVKEGRAARFFRRTGEGVYDMDDLARATAKMAGFVKAHAEEADGPVFGLGYSNGANILASVLFAEPQLFSAAVLMHPLIPFVPRITGSLAGRRILITAGEADPICPPEMVKRLETYLKAAGADVETVWHEDGHEMQPGEVEAARRFLGRAGDDMKAGEK